MNKYLRNCAYCKNEFITENKKEMFCFSCLKSLDIQEQTKALNKARVEDD